MLDSKSDLLRRFEQTVINPEFTDDEVLKEFLEFQILNPEEVEQAVQVLELHRPGVAARLTDDYLGADHS